MSVYFPAQCLPSASGLWTSAPRIRVDVTLSLPAFILLHTSPPLTQKSFVCVMRVPIYTEIEPPEQRGCPPLPLEGPILLQVLFPSTAVPALPGAGGAAPVVCSQFSDALVIQPASMSPAVTLLPAVTMRSLTAFLVKALLVVSVGFCIICIAAGTIKLSDPDYRVVRPASDVPSSVSCPAWQGSDPSCSVSCPRPYLGSSLLEIGPYLCPTDARRGHVEFMARGLARTSSALDAKRVYIKLCPPSARRGFAACPIMGYLNRLITSALIMGYVIIGIIKTKLNHPFEGNINVKSSVSIADRSSVAPAGIYNEDGIQMTLSYPFQGGCVASLITGNPFNYLERFADCAPTSAAASPSSSLIFGGGARQSINGRRLSPHLVHANGIPSWIHMEYTFEFQCTRANLGEILERHRNCIAVQMPLSKIIHILTKPEVLALSKLHQVWIPARLSAAKCKERLMEHQRKAQPNRDSPECAKTTQES
ncbi:hypothetical protein DFH06DRAFT_1298053 [Mycena polygramma]|nr:hypothetical protein DFH06DRAFT_1298053 [Mycena polygramma]